MSDSDKLKLGKTALWMAFVAITMLLFDVYVNITFLPEPKCFKQIQVMGLESDNSFHHYTTVKVQPGDSLNLNREEMKMMSEGAYITVGCAK